MRLKRLHIFVFEGVPKRGFLFREILLRVAGVKSGGFAFGVGEGWTCAMKAGEGQKRWRPEVVYLFVKAPFTGWA